mgnify:CR=1 FL=1
MKKIFWKNLKIALGFNFKFLRKYNKSLDYKYEEDKRSGKYSFDN